jgi:hypothetical protein
MSVEDTPFARAELVAVDANGHVAADGDVDADANCEVAADGDVGARCDDDVDVAGSEGAEGPF